MTIDSHHHFWRYSVEEYGWIDDAMKVIRRDFLPDDLRAEIRGAGVDGVISVQARQTLDETRWLLSMAEQNDFIKGVVGWVPLQFPETGTLLEQFSSHWKLRAVRHVCQGEPDGFMLGKSFNAGIARLKEFGLVYDILIFERQLREAAKFVDQHPEQVFVLDHIAKPRIKANELDPWRENIRELARRPNVYCKISGLVTEADYNLWSPAQLAPYVEHVLEVFGPKRLMLGSDWPVIRVACDYAKWIGLVRGWIAKLSPAEQARILGGTAVEAYGLKNE
jgi:L-fuconolactonase